MANYACKYQSSATAVNLRFKEDLTVKLHLTEEWIILNAHLPPELGLKNKKIACYKLYKLSEMHKPHTRLMCNKHPIYFDNPGTKLLALLKGSLFLMGIKLSLNIILSYTYWFSGPVNQHLLKPKVEGSKSI